MIADQLTHDRLTYRPDHLDIEMCRGELRSIHNRTDRQALLLVTVAHPVAEVA